MNDQEMDRLIQTLLRGETETNYCRALMDEGLQEQVSKFAEKYFEVFMEAASTGNFRTVYDFLENNMSASNLLAMEANATHVRSGNADGPAPANLLAVLANITYNDPALDLRLSEDLLSYLKAFRARTGK